MGLCQSILVVKRTEKEAKTLRMSVTRCGINNVVMFRNGEH